MAETLGSIASYAAPVASIVGGIASLTSRPKTPQVASLTNPGSVLGLGYNSPLTTPGYAYKGGELVTSPLGEGYNDAIGRFLVGGGLDAMRSRQVNTALGQIGQARAGFGQSLTDIQGLRAQVKPGFGALTDARVTAIRDAAAESIGNLRDSMARRGVMGSSFANDAEARTRLAYAREEGLARSEAKIAEISATSSLISQELSTQAQIMGLSQAEAGVYQQDISNAVTQATQISQELVRQLNEFNVSGNIANGVASAVGSQAYAQAQLQMLSQGIGAFNQGVGLKSIASGLEGLGKVING